MKKRNLKIFVLGFISLIAVSAIIGFGTAEIIHKTSGKEFCGSCHVMQPMINAYEKDTHSGNNSVGVVAECTDCHVSHKNTLSFLLDKAYYGTNDLYMVLFHDVDKIDFYKKRHERETFVYDSGCLSCHKKILESSKLKNPKALEMHAHYKQTQKTEKPLKCASCHVTVGHAGLIRTELNIIKPEYKFGEELIKDGKSLVPPNYSESKAH